MGTSLREPLQQHALGRTGLRRWTLPSHQRAREHRHVLPRGTGTGQTSTGAVRAAAPKWRW